MLKLEIKSQDDMLRLKEIEAMGVDIDCLEFLDGYHYGIKGNKVAQEKTYDLRK